MGKKKGKKGKGKKNAVVGPSADILRENYRKACNLIGEEQSEDVLNIIDTHIGEGQVLTQLCIGDVPLGPAGVRCVAAGLMGELPGMEEGTYLNLTNLHFWRCAAKDDGTIALAKLIMNENKDFKLGVLDLMDNQVGLRGCMALGKALADGANRSLLHLSLNANALDAKCVGALAEGLMSNSTLKKLSLEYCKLGPDCGPMLGGILASAKTGLSKMKLKGNHLRCDGLQFLALSLRRNKALTELDLEDNEIGGFPPNLNDIQILANLAASLAENQTLTTLNLNMNPLADAGAEALKEGVAGNKTLTALNVDISLPEVLFDSLYRAGGKKKKGKKKKKKK